jgi:hypothetical protein
MRALTELGDQAAAATYLTEPIRGPQKASDSNGKAVYEGAGPVEQRDHRKVDGQVCGRLQDRSLEAVRGNGSAQCSNCEGNLIYWLPSALLCEVHRLWRRCVSALPHDCLSECPPLHTTFEEKIALRTARGAARQLQALIPIQVALVTVGSVRFGQA